MHKISILTEPLINKIAAGEVIERPASIVRELVDNSIDSGAKRIAVEILYGGKKLIKVSDNGAGMDRDDASLCFERHATSKIKSENDLFNIITLGFRGEALASIAAVSKVTLITSFADSRTGTKIEIGARRKKEIADAPRLSGTILEVRDVFYNTPARKKFLKSVPTELSHIIETVTQKALSYPEISFVLKHDDSEILNASVAEGIKGRFVQLYGEELFGEFVETNRDGWGVRLYGFVSARDFTRSTRNYQYIFINRRPVKNPTISHAVYSAYKGLIPKDRYPAFFLFFEIDPRKVDVNVHPAKREVRFESAEEIHKLVLLAVRDALNLREEITAGHVPYSELAKSGEMPNDVARLYSGSVRETLESAFHSQGDLQADFFADRIAPALHKYFYVGDAFVAEPTNNGLLIIDRHAVHERVLYEKFLKKISFEVESLVFPIRVELPAKEFNIIKSHKELLLGFGLDIGEFGSNDVIIRALPRELRKADMKRLLLDIASGILEGETTGIKGETGEQDLLQNIAAKLACHKSVRGREPLNDEELSKLVADLDKADVPDKCPHGRPTRIFISLDELRKMFKRK